MSKYKCSLCDYVSDIKKSIEKHINNKTLCGEGVAEILEIPTEIKCDHCNKEFATRPNLTRHLKNCKTKKNNIESKVELLENKLDEANKKLAESLKKEKENEIKKDQTSGVRVFLDKNAIRAEARKLYCKHFELICVHCKSDDQDLMQIAHIKALKDFTTSCLIGDINKLSNIICLCANCHLSLDKSKSFKVQRTATLYSFIIRHLSSIADYEIL